ncbi:hypothetical protein E2C01_093572 [Portunus trituberculatus]|uniref:Uncharacterized protein n=1 Tax=Portunus trituberculatus TaxID=210409 RepID=A0A5B7JUJ5_PORTR|nr:hypothetical protein [Portunus trituberculatus]
MKRLLSRRSQRIRRGSSMVMAHLRSISKRIGRLHCKPPRKRKQAR